MLTRKRTTEHPVPRQTWKFPSPSHHALFDDLFTLPRKWNRTGRENASPFISEAPRAMFKTPIELLISKPSGQVRLCAVFCMPVRVSLLSLL